MLRYTLTSLVGGSCGLSGVAELIPFIDLLAVCTNGLTGYDVIKGVDCVASLLLSKALSDLCVAIFICDVIMN